MNVTTNPAELVMIPRAEYDVLTRENADLKAYIAELESKLNWLTEQVRLSRVRRFGASSESAGQEVLEQMSLLFNEAEFHADEAVKPEKTVVREHERKKRSGSVRDVVPKNITVEEVRHELPEEERVCPQCGDIMEPIGTEAAETPELIPAGAVVRRDVYVKYACQNCKVNDIEVPIVGTPKKPVAHSGRIRVPQGRRAHHDAKILAARPSVPSGTGLETAGAVSLPSGHVGLGLGGRGHLATFI